jgi:predicted Zn-dependent protease
LEAAGYDGWGLVRFMETIRRQSPAPEGVPAYLFTHPLPENRSTYLAQALEGAPQVPRDPARLGALWRAQARVLADDPRPWGQALLEQRAAENPESPDAQLSLAIGLEAAGRTRDAEVALKRARDRAPDDQEIIEETASLLLRMGRQEEGVASLEAQRARGTITEAALRDLGWSYLEAQEGARALAIYDDMAKRSEGGHRWEKLDYYRGLALGKAGREGEAHATLGDYFRGAGDGQLSGWHYRQALRLLPPGPLRDRVSESLRGEPAAGQ